MTNEQMHLWCDKAGKKAADEHTPQAMVVQQHKHVLDDNSPVVKEWHVAGGVCGFAWVNIKPGTCSFAKWLVKNGKGRSDSYYGGVTVWVGDYGQSMTTKQAYCGAYAKMYNALRPNMKSNAMPYSRMD